MADKMGAAGQGAMKIPNCGIVIVDALDSKDRGRLR
jgi:hypothetical protein